MVAEKVILYTAHKYWGTIIENLWLDELEKIYNYIESYNGRGLLLSFSILPKSTICW